MSEEDKVDIEDAPFELEDKDASDDVPMEHDVDHVDDREVDDVELADEDFDDVDFEEEEDGLAVATARRDLNLAVNTVLNQQVNSLARPNSTWPRPVLT